MRELVLSKLEGGYDKDKHILLGSWNFKNCDELIDEHFSDLSTDPFLSPEDYLEYTHYCHSVFYYYFPQVSAHLNKTNNSNFSKEFWRIMLTPFFIFIIDVALERFFRLRKVMAKIGKDKILVKGLETEEGVPFVDTLDMVYRGLYQTKFNHWLYTKLLKKSWGDQVKFQNQTLKGEELLTGEYSSIYPKEIKRSMGSLFEKYSPFKSLKGLTKIERVLFSIILLFKKKPVENRIPLRKPIFSKEKIDEVIDWKELFTESLPKMLLNLDLIPAESWSSITNFIVASGTSLHYSETNKLALAKHVEKGGGIVAVQHGGDYGYCKYYNHVEAIEYSQSRFASWGWGSHGDFRGNFVGLPSFNLRMLRQKMIKKKKQAGTGKIIWVGTHMNIHSARVGSSPQSCEAIIYRKDKKKALKELYSLFGERLYYRPFMFREDSNRGLADTSYFSKEIPGLKILSGSLEEASLGASLVIVDHPGTVLLENWASGIQTIGYWDRELWRLTDEASQQFKELEAEGLIFTDRSKLIDFVSKNFLEDPDKEVLKKSAIFNKFVNNYAESRNAFSRWLSFLLRL